MVKKSKFVVVWDKSAYTSLQKMFEYIREHSQINAEKVREEILKVTHSLPDHPKKYTADKFKKGNKGEYRAFEKYSYRIAYKITAEEIIILRVRHVKQEPKGY